MPDGSWVVGLFNREDSWQFRSVDFARDLGLTGSVQVMDLWAQFSGKDPRVDQGASDGATGFSTWLSPHDSVLVKIVPEKRERVLRYEAEVASLIQGAKANANHAGFSGFGFADGFDRPGARVIFGVRAESSFNRLRVRYANATGTTMTAALYANDRFAGQLAFAPQGTWDDWAWAESSLQLPNEEITTIEVRADPRDGGRFNLDVIELM